MDLISFISSSWLCCQCAGPLKTLVPCSRVITPKRRPLLICGMQVILMAGLQGVGKTTACGKLALYLKVRLTWCPGPATRSNQPICSCAG